MSNECPAARPDQTRSGFVRGKDSGKHRWISDGTRVTCWDCDAEMPDGCPEVSAPHRWGSFRRADGTVQTKCIYCDKVKE